MMRRRPGHLTSLIVVLGVAAALPRERDVVSAADRPVPFRVGEVLTYDVSWSKVLTAGTVVMSVRERRNLGGGRSGYYCLAEAKPSWLIEKLYHLYYKADAVIDTATLQPQWSSIYSDEKGRIKNRLTKFLAGRSIEYQQLTSKDGPQKRAVPPSTFDILSAVYALRAEALRAGQSVSMPVTDGGKLLRLRASVAGPESIKTALGTLPAWRLTPTIADEQGRPTTEHTVTMWISQDARRLPLKLQAGLSVGTVTLTLARADGTGR